MTFVKYNVVLERKLYRRLGEFETMLIVIDTCISKYKSILDTKRKIIIKKVNLFLCNYNVLFSMTQIKVTFVVTAYSKTPLLRPPLGRRKNGLYSGVVLLLS